jgi:hypothetical protein
LPWTGIRAVTAFLAASIRATSRAPKFATQTSPPLTARPACCTPTRIRATTVFVAGSIRATESPSTDVTQIEPAPNATA